MCCLEATGLFLVNLADAPPVHLLPAQVPPGKTLVVKFADRAIASRAAAVNPAAYQQAGNGNGVFYM